MKAVCDGTLFMKRFPLTGFTSSRNGTTRLTCQHLTLKAPSKIAADDTVFFFYIYPWRKFDDWNMLDHISNRFKHVF